jgi:3-oxoacyl-[acyl-carrier protein] reductase
MDLGIESQVFIVTGASSGLGRAVAERIAQEGGRVLAVARRKELLTELADKFPGKVDIIAGDARDETVHDRMLGICRDTGLHGVFLNAGGPPAKRIMETTMQDWDEAYQLLVRWKISLVMKVMPLLEKQGYGRILFSESSSVKQPVENLVLSNSMRLAMAGFSKTLASEYAAKGISSNLIAPGYHDTDALARLFTKKSLLENISFEEAKRRSLRSIPSGKMGNPSEFASLAAWLLSPLSGFVTGQVYALDGGNIKSSL